VTAQDLAITTARESLPLHARDMIDRRAAAVRNRTTSYERGCAAAAALDNAARQARTRVPGMDRSIADGLELWPLVPGGMFAPVIQKSLRVEALYRATARPEPPAPSK